MIGKMELRTCGRCEYLSWNSCICPKCGFSLNFSAKYVYSTNFACFVKYAKQIFGFGVKK